MRSESLAVQLKRTSATYRANISRYFYFNESTNVNQLIIVYCQLIKVHFLLIYISSAGIGSYSADFEFDMAV